MAEEYAVDKVPERSCADQPQSDGLEFAACSGCHECNYDQGECGDGDENGELALKQAKSGAIVPCGCEAKETGEEHYMRGAFPRKPIECLPLGRLIDGKPKPDYRGKDRCLRLEPFQPAYRLFPPARLNLALAINAQSRVRDRAKAGSIHRLQARSTLAESLVFNSCKRPIDLLQLLLLVFQEA